MTRLAAVALTLLATAAGSPLAHAQTLAPEGWVAGQSGPGAPPPHRPDKDAPAPLAPPGWRGVEANGIDPAPVPRPHADATLAPDGWVAPGNDGGPAPRPGRPKAAPSLAPDGWQKPAGRAAPPIRPEPPAQSTAPAPDAPATRPEDPGCRADLAATGAVFETMAAIDDAGCGAPAPVRVSAVGDVALSSPAVLRCDAALALARWITDVVMPSAVLHLGAEVETVGAGSSYVCRKRRTDGGGATKLSEHALANAVDIGFVRLADGRQVVVAPRPDSAAPERAFQAAVRGGGCALFTTVLGPGTNALHADHLHLDRAYRRGGYRICQ
ncbi:MAG: extensin family protein [Acuticoccus sp.]